MFMTQVKRIIHKNVTIQHNGVNKTAQDNLA
ncbi:hypothetical protein NB724_002051 [Pantoea ananatis]|uniref:Uncharacterized protein n=1 Tax=Pantoea ananas TaxID=553 RepID=A0AAJ1D078_PANAN|nr:hypothetical protein [Pantoea ananatis]MCW0316900.1 hypothetical protein [Pantoea ananatis]MCW0331247.1 hypothetical protein [Pantoea ananatis]MCW0334899.1 hypothetical protein [Pantoea ananatis]MCW0344824.1 hypothetical protein [Pantoea ananatis]